MSSELEVFTEAFFEYKTFPRSSKDSNLLWTKGHLGRRSSTCLQYTCSGLLGSLGPKSHMGPEYL